MRRRRDSFGRQTFVPIRSERKTDSCGECGTSGRVYFVRIESDGGRNSMARGGPFCSWSCAESYHGTTFPK